MISNIPEFDMSAIDNKQPYHRATFPQCVDWMESNQNIFWAPIAMEKFREKLNMLTATFLLGPLFMLMYLIHSQVYKVV